MIPKIIHYCWFGKNPLPESAHKCILSWKKHFPDYIIKEWNEDNFDVNMIAYTREAYRLKKYAFVSDYARFWILYNYGGLYFDVDVEIIKPMYDIIESGAFAGFESNSFNNTIMVNPGLGLGATSNMKIYKEMLDFYSRQHFVNWFGGWTGTVVVFFTNHLIAGHDGSFDNIKTQIKGITIYPTDYFCPKDYFSGEINITSNTRTIHHYKASWVMSRNLYSKVRERLLKFFIRHFY